MRGIFKLYNFIVILVFTGSGFLFPVERYALVIGNNAYQSQDIISLANPANDAEDVAAALEELDYEVTLKTNLGLRELRNAILDFTGALKKDSDSEGFFWYAGHGLSVRNIHYLLPVDVDPTDDFSVTRTAFSVDDLMEEIENARNKTNLIVIDACRNNVLPRNRSVGGRGLVVLAQDDYRVRGNKLVYSTMAGMVASDGISGSRNSPFAEAFISLIGNREPFDDLFLDIAAETLRLTQGVQEPYAMGAFAVKSYTIHPEGPSGTYVRVYPGDSPQRRNPAEFILDGKKILGISFSPIAYGSSFQGKGVGVEAAFTFFEKYGRYGDFFIIPNSFFVSADLSLDSHNVKSSLSNLSADGELTYFGGIFGLGTQWKIRVGTAQRFIANFGFSIEFFAGRMELYHDQAQSSDKKAGEYPVIFDPGMGLRGGLGFRFSPLVSLDFGVLWKIPFIGTDLGMTVYHSIGGIYSHSTTEYFAKGVRPYMLGGSLGVSFWFPR